MEKPSSPKVFCGAFFQKSGRLLLGIGRFACKSTDNPCRLTKGLPRDLKANREVREASSRFSEEKLRKRLLIPQHHHYGIVWNMGNLGNLKKDYFTNSMLDKILNKKFHVKHPPRAGHA